MRIEEAWSRGTPPAVLCNYGFFHYQQSDCYIGSASGDVCRVSVPHRMSREGGMMKIHQVKGLEHMQVAV